MLDSIKSLIERATRRAEGDAIAGWARRAGYVHKREKDGDGFAIEGSFDGTPWRMEWGAPQRRYIEGHELRMRMVLGVSSDLQMLLMTKSLKERLASEAFALATQSNQTALDDSVGEETRWLVVFPKVPLGESQIVRSCYGLVALRREGERLARQALLECLRHQQHLQVGRNTEHHAHAQLVTLDVAPLRRAPLHSPRRAVEASFDGEPVAVLLALVDIAGAPRPTRDGVAFGAPGRALDQRLDRAEHGRLRSTRVMRRRARADTSGRDAEEKR